MGWTLLSGLFKLCSFCAAVLICVNSISRRVDVLTVRFQGNPGKPVPECQTIQDSDAGRYDEGGCGDLPRSLQYLRSSSQITIPTYQLYSSFRGRMPFLSPNQVSQHRRQIHGANMATARSLWSSQYRKNKSPCAGSYREIFIFCSLTQAAKCRRWCTTDNYNVCLIGLAMTKKRKHIDGFFDHAPHRHFEEIMHNRARIHFQTVT